MKQRIVFFLLVFFAFTQINAQVKTISSPNGILKLSFYLDNDGVAFYSLSKGAETVILPSQLGFDIKNGAQNFSNSFELLSSEIKQNRSSWEPVWGEQKVIVDNHNELLIRLKCHQQFLDIRFRLFDDGLGFRYEFPKQDSVFCFTIGEELTQFQLTGDCKAFWMPGDYNANEYFYTTCKISEMPSQQNKANHHVFAQIPVKNLSTQTPLMLKSNNGLYINIHEAALLDYPAMQLNVDANKYLLSSHLTPDVNGGKGDVNLPFNTPWRTIIVSADARDILASKIILNLNEACTYEDVSWIKPVKYIGVWWEMFVGRGTWAYSDEKHIKLGVTDFSKLKPNGKHSANNANVKYYIDFAAKHGFDQVLVEGWNVGWEDWINEKREYLYDFVTPYPDFDVEMLRDYALEKGVKLMMHHETGGSATNYERHLNDAFEFMNKHNYNAVKTGYVSYIRPKGEHHDGQWMVNHYAHVARTAAKYKVMINSHEAVRPTGLHRTFPNWLAQESARGTEYEAMGGLTPEHTTILAFTRLIGGPMDYTPGIMQTVFSHYDPKNKVQAATTLAKQLAYYVTLYSPLQMAADLPENYERFSDAFQFIKDVAVDWDETYILEAEPGDYVSIARKAKAKNEWFVGAITDENERIATIDLSFLPKNQKFVAHIYMDADDAHWKNNPMRYTIKKQKVNAKTMLKLRLAPGGGLAISIKPE